MFDYTGWIVRSAAGHDKEQLFFVVGMDQDNARLLLADGKRRKAASPKAKKLGHVQILDEGSFQHPVVRKLQEKETVSDRELQRALAIFKGGNHAWQKTI